jgi:hypothetical protein
MTSFPDPVEHARQPVSGRRRFPGHKKFVIAFIYIEGFLQNVTDSSSIGFVVDSYVSSYSPREKGASCGQLETL